MPGTIIEQNGDGLLEDSHMPVGWPLHIDGAVRQCCIHRSATLQELDDMLKEYDMKKDSVEINHNAPQGLTTQCGTGNTRNRSQDTHCGNCRKSAVHRSAVRSNASSKFLQNYAGGRVRQPRTPNTSAERKFTNLIKLKQYRVKRIVSPSTPTC